MDCWCVSSWHTALLTTWGLEFGGVWTLASAYALCLPTNSVKVFQVKDSRRLVQEFGGQDSEINPR